MLTEAGGVCGLGEASSFMVLTVSGWTGNGNQPTLCPHPDSARYD
jgi:hypothetical protein